MEALFTGFIFGFLHVVSGPDHLAAVAPLSVKSPKSGWKSGLQWGLGHSGGVLIIGLLALLLRESINIELISHFNEKIVAGILIVIGIWGFLSLRKVTIHSHSHDHQPDEHSHTHIHVGSLDHHNHRIAHTALGVGVIHGLAGSSHLLGVLPALAFPTVTGVILYLTAFTIGTIGAMTGFAGLLGFASEKLGTKNHTFYKGIMATASLSAIVVGIFWFFI